MSYNKEQFQTYIQTAGKISILSAFAGVLVFTFIFLLNIGAKEFKQAIAQSSSTAQTTVTVLNTPPAFDTGPFESPESSTSSPTNSGDVMSWTAVASDPSLEDYYLLICDGNATPTAVNGGPPTCGGSDVLWAVSGLTNTGAQATAATTTTEAFAEENDWYAWVCDSVPNARCNVTPQQGTGSTSSPFNVNHRPTFTGYWDDSPADPGATVIFYATSTDADTTGTQDTVSLYVCSTPSFNATSSLGCNGIELASTTVPVSTNATATYQLGAVMQDDDYPAYGFIVDNHGHPSIGVAQGTDSILTVNNVAPTITGAQIILNDGLDIDLVTEGGETTGFLLSFQVTDANSCDAVGGNTYDEIVDYTASVFRSGVGTTSCDSAGEYNANNCYPSQVATTTWNLECTASTTSCTYAADDTDTTLQFDCTFPLWYIADPTDVNAFYFDESWLAAVSGIDDDAASSEFVPSTNTNIELNSLLALNLLDTSIPYGPLEPGTDSVNLNASTTVETTGNTGLNQELYGESMCNSFVPGSPCQVSSTSTIPVDQQQYATSAVSYGSGFTLNASTTPQVLESLIPKSQATTTPSSRDTFWGIAIPGTITFAGNYFGENVFTAVVSATSTWGN